MKKLLLALFLLPLTAWAAPTYQAGETVGTAGLYGEAAICDAGTTTESLQCSAKGLKVDVQGMTPGTGATDLGKAEDSPHASSDTGIAALAVADASPGLNAADGDYANLLVGSKGALFVDINTAAQNASATSLLKAEDAAAASGDAVVAMAGVMSTSPGGASITAGTVGDYATPIITNLGAMYVDPIGNSSTVCVAITPDDDAAYTANDVVATEDATDPLSFANVFRASVHSGILSAIQITNTEIDGVGWRLVLFDADPSTSTTTDGSALTVADADLTKIVGQVSVSDCTAYADNELCQATNVGLAIDGAATGIYAALITPGVPQWAASQTVNVCLTFLQD